MKMETRKVRVMTIEGKPVMDGVAKKILTILPEDVKAAQRKDANCCAAAMACMRQFKVQRAKVNLSRVYLEYPSVWVRYLTPPSLRTEIVSWDRGYEGFKGGEFSLSPLPPTQRSGGDPERKERSPRNASKKNPRKGRKTTDVRNAMRVDMEDQ